MNIRVGTFNILNTSCRYEERKNLIKKTIEDIDCDILGLQEINLEENPKQFNLEIYTMCFVPLVQTMKKVEPNFTIDGNAVLIKKDIEVVNQERLIYSDQQRVAQILTLKKGQAEFIMVNTHLDHLSDITREAQVRELLEYLKSFRDKPIICTGDFNFIPESRAYEMITKEFRSSQLVCNKKDPELTFPTGLLGDYTDLDEYGCFDYIWFKGAIKPLRAEVFRNCGNHSIWASDHYPLYADFTFLI